MSKETELTCYDFEVINSRMLPIAEKLVEKYQELQHIDPKKILFILNSKKGSSKKGSVTLACTTRIPANRVEIMYQLTGGTCYWYKIEFYSKTTACMDENQMIALLYTQLRRIGPEGKLVNPDVHDWYNVLVGLGHKWFYPNETCPNLLDDGVTFENLASNGQNKLF